MVTTTRGHRFGGRQPGRRFAVHPGSLLREAVFGINDGLVATVGLVSGEVLSGQPRASVLIAALSAVGAATVSMAIGSYLASSAQNDLVKKQIHEQHIRIRRQPRQERAVVDALLDEMGVARGLRRAMSETITGDRGRWLRFLVRQRLGWHEDRTERPVANAVIMAIGVVLGSIPPTLPFLLPLTEPVARNLAWSLSLAAAFALGAVKGKTTASPVWRSGLQFMLLAGASSTVGASIGLALGHRVG